MSEHSHEPELFDRLDLSLTLVTLAGMAYALVDRFAIVLPLPELALLVVFLAGAIPAAITALRELFTDHILDVDLLMVIATLAAALVGAPLEGGMLLTLFRLSSMLEHRALGKARRAVEALMSLRPETAFRLAPDGTATEIPIGMLAEGDHVIIRPGARIPVDGRIVKGTGSLDESTITGESIPMVKAPGDRVFEATVNLHTVLTVEVLHPVAESTVARMIAMVTEAQAQKAPSERFSAWFGQRYTIAVLAGSIALLLAFLAMGQTFDAALYRAATVLVAASPCAVVISVPASILSALSAAARGGVLFKGGAALETLATVSTFAFDKTGTLTTGQAEVTRLLPLAIDENTLLSLIGGLEAHSEHPIADALRRSLNIRGLTPAPVSNVVTYPSEGITGTDPTGQVWAGNPRMANRMGADLTEPTLASLQDSAETVVYLGRGPQLLGAVAVADQVRATSRDGIAALRREGISGIVMMTGDRHPVALRIGQELGLKPEEIHADLLPADKVTIISNLATRGRVAFVGDGVNDAAALARADVGIAMGAAGSEVALQAAEVALLSENMDRLAAALRLSRRTATVIRQNLVFALGAMAVLVIGGMFFDLPLPLAVLGHEGGTVLVVLNGLRLLFDPIRTDKTTR